jgi:precorrin-3B synthase
MNAPHRRGACPGLSAPMQTGDGWLVRLASLGATIGLEAAAALCAAARRHGNGIIEVTARGNIQIRGLTPASALVFADAVAALDIAARDGVAILVDPLAGLEAEQTSNSSEIAAALRRRLAAAAFAAMLGPKVSVVIDGGSALHLDGIQADIRLRSGDAGWHVGLGGDGKNAAAIGWVTPENAVEAMARLLEMMAQRGPRARARDLILTNRADGFRAVIADLLSDTADAPARINLSPRPASDPIGMHPLRDGVALGVGVAFGHTDADALERLIESAKRAGARGLRTAPARALLLTGITADTAPTLAADSDKLGFITRGDDPRRHVVACAGAPICASAEIPARTLGPMISATAPALLDGSLTVHVSGCPKGCAHAAATALTIVGGPDRCGLVIDGFARDQPVAAVATADLPASIERIAREVAHAGRQGEKAVETLARLDPARIAAIFGATRHG